MSALEIVGFVTSVIAVYLTTRESIWNWPIGLVSVAVYAKFFLDLGLYSDAGLQVVYVAMISYGWYHWLRGGTGSAQLPVSRMTRREWVVLGALGAVVWATLAAVTSKLQGVALPYIDSATTTASLAAQWMTTRKLLENWIVWIVADVVYIGVYVYKGAWLTAVLYAVFLVLAVMGYRQWKASLARRSLA